MDYSPSDVVAEMLTLVKADPGDTYPICSTLTNGVADREWPVYAMGEPDLPDSVVTVYDTVGRTSIRDSITGAVSGSQGLMFRIRSTTPKKAYNKASEIYNYLSKTCYRQGVTIGSSYYLIHCFEGFGDILPLGKETPNSKRSIVTFNVMVAITDQTPNP